MHHNNANRPIRNVLVLHNNFSASRVAIKDVQTSETRTSGQSNLI